MIRLGVDRDTLLTSIQEAAVVLSIVKEIAGLGLKQEHLGIIAPYNAQVCAAW